MISFLYNCVKIAIILIMPFIILIRGSVFLHFNKGWPAMGALLGSGLMTAVLLALYFSVFYGRLTKKRTRIKYLRRRFAVSFVLVGFFVLHGLVFLSKDQAKSSEVHKEYHSLQPILRLGLSTIFLLDRKAIVTDGSRVPEDYGKMGLKTAGQSLHYPQQDGYAYAVDLRTKGRWEWRNQMLNMYFNMMGFNTLRHTGTADHLHVSMPCRFRKQAK